MLDHGEMDPVNGQIFVVRQLGQSKRFGMVRSSKLWSKDVANMKVTGYGGIS